MSTVKHSDYRPYCCGRYHYCGNGCSLLQPPPKHPRLLRAAGIIFGLLCLLMLVGAPFAILYGYAMWVGDCGAHGGHVVGAATETRCEGAR